MANKNSVERVETCMRRGEELTLADVDKLLKDFREIADGAMPDKPEKMRDLWAVKMLYMTGYADGMKAEV